MRYILCFLMLCCLLGYSDVLVLRSEKKEGVFLGYNRGYFTFCDGKTLEELNLNDAAVVSMTLEEPLVCTLTTKRNTKKSYSVKVFGYAERRFDMEIDGVRRSVHAQQIGKMGYELTPPQIKARWDAMMIKKGQTPEANFMDLLPTGKVFVVHFLLQNDKNEAGKKAEELCKNSKKPAVYLKIVLKDKNDPMAKKYHLDVLPQMWFLSKSRTRVNTLLGAGITPSAVESSFKNTLNTK